MTVARVSFAESALGDLTGIQEWYADEASIGRMVPEFGQTFLRDLIHPPFRIVYRLDAQRVRIVRVWRSERLLRLPASAKAPDPAG